MFDYAVAKDSADRARELQQCELKILRSAILTTAGHITATGLTSERAKELIAIAARTSNHALPDVNPLVSRVSTFMFYSRAAVLVWVPLA